ncbi:MAG: isoprenyl transferase [Pseudomonadota bacterium]
MSSNAADAHAGDALPVHVAIIMDGNGRWAKKKLLNRVKGHERGVETVRLIARACGTLGIPYLTLYAFSTENWQRPKAEVTALMVLLGRFLENELPELQQQQIRLNAIGELHRLPDGVREKLALAIAATRHNTRLTMTLALSYGGRAEITAAVQAIARRVAAGELNPEAITAEDVSRHLSMAGIPDPDLLIRTSGEQRISNFLLWQIAYSELFITETLWPDFSEAEFTAIIKAYAARDRRFGAVR